MQKPIVIIGMMGSGKTVIARSLAHELGVPFYDSDEVVMLQESKTINKIFASDGESVFREIEANVVHDLIQKIPSVISTGGGAITTASVLKAIKEQAVSVWIKSDVDVILERLEGDTSRPLLQGQDPRARLESLLKEREKLYAQADIHVENNSNDVEQVVRNILEHIQDKDAAEKN